MRGRNSSKYYRRNSYKKRKLRNILIISGICLVVLFLLFVIFGNLLDKKIDTERAGRDKGETTAEIPQDAAPYSIEAYPVDINADVTAQIKEMSSKGVSAISLKLTDTQGKLMVYSDIASSLGYQSKSDALVDISAVISRAKYYGMHSSAVLDLQFPTQKDAKQKAVMLAYESALVAEVAEKGAGEVIVRVPSTDAMQIGDLTDFAESVKSINDTVVLGVALPRDFFYGESSAENVAKLAQSFDIVGIDASNMPSDTTDTLEYLESVFSESNLKYYVLRYNMRVLLPQVSNDQDEELRAVLKENSIQNWQKIS